MMDWNEISSALDEKLDPKHVKKPSGSFGPKGDYIEGWWAISEANRIFGHGNWSYSIKGLTKDDVSEGTDSKGNPQWRAAYTCIVTVRVGDVIREDVGFGSGFAKQIGDAIEGATKEAVTDALKRCLRTFGNPFGLALYDKEKTNVGKPEADPAQKRDWVRDRMLRKTDLSSFAEFWERDDVQAMVARLPQQMQDDLRADATRHAGKLGQAPEGVAAE